MNRDTKMKECKEGKERKNKFQEGRSKFEKKKKL